MTVTRGTTNRNQRGSSYNRRARKLWLLSQYGIGSPTRCRCFRCKCWLYFTTITVDRITPGCEGGTYRRDNIRPACGKCNSETGGQLGAARRAATRGPE